MYLHYIAKKNQLIPGERIYGEEKHYEWTGPVPFRKKMNVISPVSEIILKKMVVF